MREVRQEPGKRRLRPRPPRVRLSDPLPRRARVTLDLTLVCSNLWKLYLPLPSLISRRRFRFQSPREDKQSRGGVGSFLSVVKTLYIGFGAATER